MDISLGNLYVRYLYWNDGLWVSNYRWLCNGWRVSFLSAQLTTLFISLLLWQESYVL